jgi:hypothetical protein
MEKKRQRSDKGPWLLTEETLEKFDAVMEKAYNYFSDLKKKDDERYSSNLTKSLRIEFNDGTSADFDSFKEFSVSKINLSLRPVQFKYEIDFSSNKINIELSEEWSTRSFQYYIRCEDNTMEDNLIYEINKIYTAERPNKLIMLISKIGLYSWFFYFIFLIVIIAVNSGQYQAPINNMIKTKIYQILSKDELVKEDYFDIIRYKTIYDLHLYTLMENEELAIVRNKINTIFNYYLLIGFLLCIIISINPRATFAAGRNISKVKFWRFYYKVIYYFIPVIIILPILINIISQIIAKKY